VWWEFFDLCSLTLGLVFLWCVEKLMCCGFVLARMFLFVVWMCILALFVVEVELFHFSCVGGFVVGCCSGCVGLAC